MNKRPLVEIAVVFVLILVTIWIAPLLSHDKLTARRIGYGFAAASLAVAIASNIRHHDSLKDVGLRLDNLFAALRLLAAPMVIIIATLLLVGLCRHSLHFAHQRFLSRPVHWFLPLGQQYLLQGFLNRRLQDAYGEGRKSRVIAAFIFAMLHLPNPALMVGTFVGGVFWTWAFQRQPNLFALALSHVLIAFVFGHSLPKSILPNLKIGWAFP